MNKIRLCSSRDMDIYKTFECGQCFRWNADESGAYYGVVNGYGAKVWNEADSVYIMSEAPAEMWQDYFDLNLDYDEISRSFDCGDYLDTCKQFGMGIRILRQESWEALCSFIISQCNNISRIKGIVERLCCMYGDEIEFEGKTYYSFPSAEKLSLLKESDLAPIRCGYRAEYIIIAAKAVASGELNLEELKKTDCKAAVKKLREFRGIGEKVANCVVLFGLGHMEAFPIDVWMKRALAENFPEDFNPETLGEYAGLAQQYIFYYARTNGR